MDVHLDPSCFAPALRASSTAASTCKSDAAPPSPAGRTSADQPVGFCVALLHAMENDAGVVPNSLCVNVVMEACARVGAWEDVTRLFEGMDRRAVVGMDQSNPGEQNESSSPHDPSLPRRGRRSVRSSRADLDNTMMTPTSASYYYAIQACRGQIERLQELATTSSCDAIHRNDDESTIDEASGENYDHPAAAAAATVAAAHGNEERVQAERWVERAVTLVQRMKESCLLIRPEAVEAVKDSCIKAGMWSLATEVNRLLSSSSSERGVGRRSRMTPPQEEEDEIETNLRGHGARAAAEATRYGRSLRFEEEDQHC